MLASCELQSDPNAASVDDTVVVEVVSSVDFDKFKSFAFLSPTGDEDTDGDSSYAGINETRVRNAIRFEFARRGIVEDPQGPMLDIVVLTGTDDATGIEVSCKPEFFWYGYIGGYSGCALIEVQSVNHRVGTIVVAFGESSTQEVVLNGAMQGLADGQNVEERINAAVAEMFESYPVPPLSEAE